MMTLETYGARAKSAERILMTATTAEKNEALSAIANALSQNAAYILEENEKDLAAGRANGMQPSLLDRLALSAARIQEMADGVRAVVELPDPVGTVLSETVRPNGLKKSKKSPCRWALSP